MPEFQDAVSLAGYLRSRGASRIGIDGLNGIGKSTLAGQLAQSIGCEHVAVDDFIEKNRGAYVAHVDTKRLTTLLAGKGQFVIEGVCLLEVLARLNIKLDCFIYYKRLQHGLWADERECVIDGDVNEFLESEREIVRLICKDQKRPESLGLAEEIIRYHAARKPHEVADAIYQRSAG